MAASLFKLPGHSVFNYQPRYFDLLKDKREMRRRELRLQEAKEILESDRPGSHIKGSFGYMIQRKMSYQKSSNIRILIILFFLAFLIYIVLMADLTPLIKWLNS